MANIPIRTCIGCLTRKPKDELVRLVVGKDGRLIIDSSRKAPGRGTYLCSEESGAKKVKKECLEKAVERKAFGRAFRRRIDFKSLRELT